MQKREDLYHALFACNALEEVWCNRFPALSIQRDGPNSIATLQWLQQYLGNGELNSIVTIAWGLWHRRNKMVFLNEVISSVEEADHALSLLTDYENNTVTSIKLSLSNQVWTALALDILKLNVDGAIFAKHQRAGVGCVLQNEKGELLLVATNPELNFNNPLEIEFMAIFRGLQLMLTSRCQ